MEKDSGTTKYKVICGYLLTILLFLFSLLLIYQQLRPLVFHTPVQAQDNQKIYLAGNTLTGLYEAEALGNVFIQSGWKQHLDEYMDRVQVVKSMLDSMKCYSDQPDQIKRIDSIELLMDRKVSMLREIAVVKHTFEPDSIYLQTIEQMRINKNLVEVRPNVYTREITTLDSTYLKGEKRKRRFLFFSTTVPDSTLKVTISHHTIVDTIQMAEPVQTQDSMIQMLEMAWEELQLEKQRMNQQLGRREHALSIQSTTISNHIRRLLNDYERQEVADSIRKSKYREQLLRDTSRTIGIIALISLLIIFLLCIYILRDLSRSQHYRNKLEEANRYADWLLQARERLILTVTHDIKSPIHAIKGYIDLSEEERDPEMQRSYLEHMKGAANQILDLVSQLLDFTRLEKKEIQPVQHPFEPYQLFCEIISTFHPIAVQKQLELVADLDPSLRVAVLGDPVRIRQVVSNLLSNAIKYTDCGTVTLSACWRPENQRQGYLLFDVKDTGCGMSEEDQTLIFKEFTRLSIHEKIEGSGLGLNITQKILELLDGILRLKSVKGEGSCFTVTLPLKSAEPEMISAELLSDNTDNQVVTDSVAETPVLILDDDLFSLELTASLLKSRGISCQTTADPLQVCDLLKTGKYQALCTDIQMPGMDGFELIRRIRTLSGDLFDGARFPVIAMSGSSEWERSYYLEQGFSGFVMKPFEIDRLISELQTGRPVAYTLDTIRSFSENDAEAFSLILQTFIGQTQLNLTAFDEAARALRFAEVRRLAHKMLPMFRQLEATDIIEILVYIEQNDLNPDVCREIGRLVPKVSALIRRLLDQLSSGVS